MKKLIYLDGQQENECVTHITFPTGEKHIRITELSPEDDVVLVYNDPAGDVMKMGMAVDICRQAGVESISLVMPFVPYARQDRRATEGDPFSIQVFSCFVNSLDFGAVYITDPHSEVTPALIDRVRIVPQHELAYHAVKQLDDFTAIPIALVAPDLGAAKKIKTLQAFLFVETGIEYPVIQCDKTRDPVTGRITGFAILSGDPRGHHCLMVDDICDGGGTFLGLYDELANAGVTDQSLYVTHGIFSKGVDELLSVFNFIFSTNSFPQTKGVHTIELGVTA